eukprot:1152455-Pelagomonas_calceolata.AAC.7
MRPGAQLEASQQQHSELCQQLQGAKTTPHTVLLVSWGRVLPETHQTYTSFLLTLWLTWYEFKKKYEEEHVQQYRPVDRLCETFLASTS